MESLSTSPIYHQFDSSSSALEEHSQLSQIITPETTTNSPHENTEKFQGNLRTFVSKVDAELRIGVGKWDVRPSTISVAKLSNTVIDALLMDDVRMPKVQQHSLSIS